MKISIIICTKNRPNDVFKCLQSILNQSYSPFEIIVIDASNDNYTFLKIEKLINKDKIKYTTSKSGLTYQRNLGISKVSDYSEIVCFFDDDVILDKNYISSIVNFFDKDKDRKYLGVSGNITNEKKRNLLDIFIRKIFLITTNTTGKLLLSGDVGHIYCPNEETDVEVLSGCNMCFRKEVFSKYKLKFDEKLKDYSYMEDLDFTFRVGKFGKLKQLSNAYLFHNLSPINRLSLDILFKTYVINSNYLWHKNIKPLGLPRFFFVWRIIGKFFQSIYMSIIHLTFKPIIGLIKGVINRNYLLNNE